MKNLFKILILSLLVFSCNKGKVINGVETLYYNDNSIKEVRTYIDGEIEDYKIFYKDGSLQQESIVIDSLKSKTIFYYENGNIKMEIYTKRSDISIPRKESKVGNYILNYENGNIYLEGYKEGSNYRQINSWNKDGKQTLINGNGFYSRYYDNSESLEGEGPVKDGKLDGVWIYYNKNGSLQREETYKDGELIETKEY